MAKKNSIYERREFVLLLALGSYGLAYLAVLIAIERGQILMYLVAFTLFYYGLHYSKKTIKRFLNNDKTSKTKRS